MDAFKQRSLFIALVLGSALAVVGCEQRNSPESVGQKVDRTSDKVAAATNDVANKTADVANRTSEVMDDATLTGKVKAAMLAEPGLRSLQIGVSTKDSVVTLSGSVESAALKERAKQVAGNVAGVRSVVDNLSTQSG
jgi:osmotically-inducible protein OsmY